MDVTRMLEADHRHVEELFDKIEQARGDARSPLIEELHTSLKAHMELEEEILYPVMAPATGDEAVEEANAEHVLGRKGLGDVLALAPDQPGFGAALDAVKAGISHHVHEEEHEVFPELRKEAEVLERITQPFLGKRAELGLPTTADALAAASSRPELLATAETVSVEGSSKMTKTELADAVAQEMGLD
jgi:hypothetical protein